MYTIFGNLIQMLLNPQDFILLMLAYFLKDKSNQYWIKIQCDHLSQRKPVFDT